MTDNINIAKFSNYKLIKQKMHKKRFIARKGFADLQYEGKFRSSSMTTNHRNVNTLMRNDWY